MKIIAGKSARKDVKDCAYSTKKNVRTNHTTTGTSQKLKMLARVHIEYARIRHNVLAKVSLVFSI